MRSEREIFQLISDIASKDNRIRAVLLNGSRTNPEARKDDFRDFDIMFFVNDFDSFIRDHKWIRIFGKSIITQMPEEMIIGENSKGVTFSYLMLLEDGNRIDLTLFPIDKIDTSYKSDSQTILLLDKDKLFHKMTPASNKDYLIKKPSQKEFTDVCNEFWWVTTYVAKGLVRNEVTYAKEMLECQVRKMFMKMIEWYVGAINCFDVSFGKSGRNMKNYVTDNLYKEILSTYPDASINDIWVALIKMIKIFDLLAIDTSGKLNLFYNTNESENVKKCLTGLFMTNVHLK